MTVSNIIFRKDKLGDKTLKVLQREEYNTH